MLLKVKIQHLTFTLLIYIIVGSKNKLKEKKYFFIYFNMKNIHIKIY